MKLQEVFKDRKDGEKSVLIKTAALLMCHFLLLAVALLAVISIIPPLDMIAMDEGVPVIKKRGNDLVFAGAEQIIADDEYIYILYGTYGLVQVYDQSGAYLYSVAVCNHMNGRVEIAESCGRLYISDKKRNIYILTDGAMDRYLDRNAPEAKAVYEEQRQQWSHSDPDYAVSKASIVRVSSDGQQTCVIRRSGWMAVFQGGRLFVLFLILAVIYGYIVMLSKSKRRSNEVSG